ncbi:MAG: DUF4118 domain-containing protein [Spirochaetales bacterium]|nr:DUF4118 domain-containing protein [Spirochaetales bacterium]
MKKFSFIFESIAALLVFLIVNILFFPSDLGLPGASPHPVLFIVLLMALRYGFRRGLMVFGMSALLYTVLVIFALVVKGESPFYFLRFHYWIPLVSSFLIGAIAGFVTDDKDYHKREAEDRAERLKLLTQRLENEKDILEKTNDELSQRLIVEKSTFSILYQAAKKLTTLSEADLYEAILDILAGTIGGAESAVLILKGHELQMKAAKGNFALEERVLDREIFEKVLKEKKTITLKDTIEKGVNIQQDVFMAGPLLSGSNGEPYGIIIIQGLSFIKYNPTTVRTFSLICDWASTSLKIIKDYQLLETQGGHGLLEYKSRFEIEYPQETWGASFEQIRERIIKANS